MLTAPFINSSGAWVTPSVVIAVLALLFTISSFWWIQVRRGGITIYPSSTYAGSFGPNKLVLIPPLVLYNTGPAPLVVLGLRMRINHNTRGGSLTEPARSRVERLLSDLSISNGTRQVRRSSTAHTTSTSKSGPRTTVVGAELWLFNCTHN